MLHLNPLFTAQTPTWFHRDLAPFEEQVTAVFDSQRAAHIIEEAQALDARLVVAGGRDIGFLWIPHPESGEIKGVGWASIVQHDPELTFEAFIAGVAIAERTSGVTTLRNLVNEPQVLPWGLSTVHELSTRHKKTGEEFHANTVWVYPEGDAAYGVTIMVNDAALIDGSLDALASFVGSLDVVQDGA